MCFRNKFQLVLSSEHHANESLHFPLADAEQVGLLEQMTSLPDQLTEVQADLVERGILDQLLGLVPVISCILITLREAYTQNSHSFPLFF
jgi:hypothetical protein